LSFTYHQCHQRGYPTSQWRMLLWRHGHWRQTHRVLPSKWPFALKTKIVLTLRIWH
jgi:hypothetical protein